MIAIGRGFSHALLQAVAGLDEPALRAALDRLADAELLFVEGVAPNAIYRFKHALIQDAAYDSLLKSRTSMGTLSSPGTFGGSGFGGQMFWVDPERELTCVHLVCGYPQLFNSMSRVLDVQSEVPIVCAELKRTCLGAQAIAKSSRCIKNFRLGSRKNRTGIGAHWSAPRPYRKPRDFRQRSGLCQEI